MLKRTLSVKVLLGGFFRKKKSKIQGLTGPERAKLFADGVLVDITNTNKLILRLQHDKMSSSLIEENE